MAESVTRADATFDVVMVTDCRFTGGTSASVAEEILAQSRAGYRTGLLHLPSSALAWPRPFSPKIRRILQDGHATLVVGAADVRTRLLLGRHPAAFAEPLEGLPRVHADEFVLAVNQVPADRNAHYDVRKVARGIERMFGMEAVWAPLGPPVRDALAAYENVVRILPWDWENVIDVGAAAPERTGFVGDRPVIGRHSRGHWAKWPDNRADILAAYPDDPRYVVSVLGGTGPVRELLGGLPANWVDRPFDSLSPLDFLRGIDFFVYFHHPGTVEAFGRAVLEALSTGAVAILPTYLERLFGDACRYGTPQDVRRYVDELYADWPAYSERSRAGVALVRERFSYDTHVRRVAELIGPPTGSAPSGRTTPEPIPPRSRALVVDFGAPASDESWPVPDVLRALSGQFSCVVAAPAERADQVGAAPVETFPRGLLAASARDRELATRLRRLLVDHRPTVVVTVDRPVGIADEVLQQAATVLEVRAGEPGAGGADERVAKLVAGVEAELPPGRSVTASVRSPSETVSGSRPGPIGTRIRRLRRRAPQWVTSRARRTAFVPSLIHWTRRQRSRAVGELARFVAVAQFDRPNPDIDRVPTALVVVSDDGTSQPEETVRALAERQQVTGRFRVALLAPPAWEPPAVRFGLPVETVLPERDWVALHGHRGWPEYLRSRIEYARRVFRPATVLLVDGTERGSLDRVLEVLEATGAPPPVT